MKFEKITIDNFKNMQHYFEGTHINEYGITPTCLYEPYDHAEFAEFNGFIITRFKDGKDTFYSVAGDYSDARLGDVLHRLYAIGNTLDLACLTREQCEVIKTFFPGKSISVTTDPEQYDYLYEIKDFINLSGNKVRHKREHYNYFINNYTFRLEEISEKNKNDCMPVINAWCDRKDCGECEYCCERDIIKALLSRFSDYPAQGSIMYVDDKPAAFLICEPLGDTVMGYHQKTVTTDMKGLSHAIYIETLKNIFSGYKYFNIGPDIGIPGLRQFKHQFKPYTMVEKYTMYIA